MDSITPTRFSLSHLCPYFGLTLLLGQDFPPNCPAAEYTPQCAQTRELNVQEPYISLTTARMRPNSLIRSICTELCCFRLLIPVSQGRLNRCFTGLPLLAFHHKVNLLYSTCLMLCALVHPVLDSQGNAVCILHRHCISFQAMSYTTVAGVLHINRTC